MTFFQFLKIMFCGCCEPELFNSFSSTTNLEKKNDVFNNDTTNLIPPGSKSQVKYTFAREDSDDSDISIPSDVDSTDSIDSNNSNLTFSSANGSTSTENQFRNSFDSNESWEVMMDGEEIYDEVKYI